jgi:hypothetical protein
LPLPHYYYYLFIIVIIITELFGVFYSINGCAPYGKFKLETSHQQQEQQQEFKYEMFPSSSVLQSMKLCFAEHEVPVTGEADKIQS